MTIHTKSGSKLEYEKIGKDRPNDEIVEEDCAAIDAEIVKSEQMELPKALNPDAVYEKIKGYRRLYPHEIEAINIIKNIGVEIGKMCDKVDQMVNIDRRWLEIGKTNLQQGLMAVIRAIAKPETF